MISTVSLIIIMIISLSLPPSLLSSTDDPRQEEYTDDIEDSTHSS